MAYVYKDKYGITHVTESKKTAQQYGGGTYGGYTGAYGGGFAEDKRAAEKAYQSAISGGGGYAPAKTPTSSYGGGYSTGTYSPSKYASEALRRAAGHTQYFGSPEAYAKAIQQKGMANLTDREAAEAFMQSRPELFGRTRGGGVSDLEAARRAAEAKDYLANLANYYAYDLRQQGATPEQATQAVWSDVFAGTPGRGSDFQRQAAALEQAAREGRPLGEVIPLLSYQQQQMQPMQPLQAQIAPLIEQLQREVQGANAETAPLVMDAYNRVIGMIDKLQSDLISRYEQQGQGVDPATQAALASLKETVGRQRENLMEEMSRRGLLQSGIWLEMENRLQRGELTEQQRLLSTRLSTLQDQLNQALANIGEMRISATQQFGAEQIRQAEAAAQRRQQAVEALTDAMMRAQEQMAQQQAEAQRMAWEREKFYAPWERGPTPAQMLPYQYPRAGELLPWEMGPTPAQMLPYQYPTASSMLPYTQGPTPYEQQRLAQAAARAARAGGGGTRGPSESEIKRQNLADLQSEIWNELNSGKTIQQVEAEIIRNANRYTMAGVDPMDMVDYAWYAATGAKKPKPIQSYW